MSTNHIAYLSEEDVEQMYANLLNDCYARFTMGASSYDPSEIWEKCATETDKRCTLINYVDGLGCGRNGQVKVTTSESEANTCLTCGKTRTYDDADSWSDDPNYCDDHDPDLDDDGE